MVNSAYQDVARLLTDYFDSLYDGNVPLMSGLYARQAHLVCVTDGTLSYMTVDQYLPLVAGREPPAARCEQRRDEIVSIEFAGPVTCVARVRCAIGPKHFTDLLTLICLDGEWQIISKVYHFDLLWHDQPD